jgi:cell fate (sporulation/competence/biofilm development) regulator YlbF (YheA/YmcA/DUF963 family)
MAAIGTNEKEIAMENILELAEKLGRAIAAHERFQALREAERNVTANEAANRAQTELEKHMNHIGELEANGKPVEVADKRKMEQLQNEFRSQPALQQLVKAQADYFEMMNKVNETIVSRLRPDN